MQFGPFTEQDIARIGPLLTEAGVAFSVDRSTSALEEWRQRWSNRDPVARPEFNGLVAAAFIEVADSDLSRLPSSVADFGLVYSDGHELDDFICPQCDFSGGASSLCPRHLTPLVSFSQKSRALQVESQTRRGVVMCLLVLAVVVLALTRRCGDTRSGSRHWVWPWTVSR